jgi:hypothetical protein
LQPAKYSEGNIRKSTSLSEEVHSAMLSVRVRYDGHDERQSDDCDDNNDDDSIQSNSLFNLFIEVLGNREEPITDMH